MTDKIQEILEKVRDHKMTAEEVSEQRISFAFGNAPKDDHSSREQVREAVTTGTVPIN